MILKLREYSFSFWNSLTWHDIRFSVRVNLDDIELCWQFLFPFLHFDQREILRDRVNKTPQQVNSLSIHIWNQEYWKHRFVKSFSKEDSVLHIPHHHRREIIVSRTNPFDLVIRISNQSLLPSSSFIQISPFNHLCIYRIYKIKSLCLSTVSPNESDHPRIINQQYHTDLTLLCWQVLL